MGLHHPFETFPDELKEISSFAGNSLLAQRVLSD